MQPETDEFLEVFESPESFIKKYENILYNSTIHFDKCYQGVVVYICYMKFNRKVEFIYKLDEFETISKTKQICHLPEKCDIFVLKLPDDYKQTKEANYLRELKQ